MTQPECITNINLKVIEYTHSNLAGAFSRLVVTPNEQHVHLYAVVL